MIPKAYTWLKNALFPKLCVICRKRGALLCDRHLVFPPAPLSKAIFHNLDQCRALTAYTDPRVQKVIQQYKYEGKKGLGTLLGTLMSVLLHDHSDETIIIPLPLHWTRFIWRGFNQATVIGKALSACTDQPFSQDLKRPKRTKQQAKLTQHKRMRNIQGAFVWKGASLEGKTIFLVDDVVASGATLDEAARILKKAGAVRVVGVVFARGGY